MTRTRSIQKFIDEKIDAVLERHLLPRNSPIRKDLDSRAEIGEGRDPKLYIRDESNCRVTPDERIEQLRDRPECRPYFPPEPPQVSLHDREKLLENFDKIRSGEVVVVDRPSNG